MHQRGYFIERYLNEMKRIQENFIDFLDNEGNTEEKIQYLNHFFEDINIRNDKSKMSILFRFISSIYDNHHRGTNFLNKIFSILQLFKEDIQKYFLNSEIYNIFKGNKQILLFLNEEKILILDHYVMSKISSEKYNQYFSPEIEKNDLPENFYDLRKKGENDHFVCKLIREYLIDDFIIYMNKNNISINSTIKPSIYETNSFLIKKQNESKSGNNGFKLIE